MFLDFRVLTFFSSFLETYNSNFKCPLCLLYLIIFYCIVILDKDISIDQPWASEGNETQLDFTLGHVNKNMKKERIVWR